MEYKQNLSLNSPSQPSRRDIHKMFDRIAAGYDLFNSVSSFGLDTCWRRRAAEVLIPTALKNCAHNSRISEAGVMTYKSSNALLKNTYGIRDKKQIKLLDVATGSGCLLLSFFEAGCDISSAVGIDMSAEMLAVAAKKFTGRKLSAIVDFKLADAQCLPFADADFDAAACAFGIRNLADPAAGLKQIYRILKPAGIVIILEFSLPKNPVLKSFYLFYLRNVIPLLGRIIAGDICAYRYLSKTIEAFPCPADFCTMMKDTGFINILATPLTFGVVTLYSAVRPPMPL